jgi:hypothetical protein
MKPGLLGAVIAVAASAATLFTSAPAEARGLHVRVGGHVHVSGGVVVRVGSPPPPPPVYYGYDPYYAPPPPPPQYYAPAPAVVAAAPEPRRPFFGLGVLASSIALHNQSTDDELQGEGVGLLGRFRLARRFELELQLSQDRFYENPRVDSRFGVAGIFDLGQPGGFTPYLVLGAGVNVIDPLGNAQDTHNDNLPAQGYLEAGFGLEWEIFQHLVISGDLRLQGRRLDKDSVASSKLTSPGASLADREDALEGRLNAIFYF